MEGTANGEVGGASGEWMAGGGGGATGKQRVKGGREASADFGFRGAGRVPSEGLGNSGGEAQ